MGVPTAALQRAPEASAPQTARAVTRVGLDRRPALCTRCDRGGAPRGWCGWGRPRVPFFASQPLRRSDTRAGRSTLRVGPAHADGPFPCSRKEPEPEPPAHRPQSRTGPKATRSSWRGSSSLNAGRLERFMSLEVSWSETCEVWRLPRKRLRPGFRFRPRSAALRAQGRDGAREPKA
jgi:hypothetical protein